MELIDHDRLTTTPETLRLLFCELREKCAPCAEYYTDGSVINGKAGYAVVSNSNTITTRRASDDNSIFTCEAAAILHTLEIIKERQDTAKSIIFSDSMSSLRAIKNQFTTNPIIQNIHQALDHLGSLQKLVSFVWTPAHVGIPGNELADEAAKAATSEDCPSTTPLTLTEAYKLIHNTIKNHWNTIWLQSKSKLHDFRRNIFETAPISGRWEQRVLTRIRIGHTHLSHSHLFSKEPHTICQRCNAPFTVKHLMIECNQYEQDRIRAGLPNELTGTLMDQNGCKKVISFLKNISLFQLM
ncbi:uncharacterized protein LOC123259049 [Cotesia glomerata]|uniref:uncharacterized protein LOC123259049 n=1 Tax=Cotesia glomerata TaxID=32391 RepID=UPI001D019E2C|nr:uncharacterized protein LOC123259049 [Cotesia glomerata]